MSSHVYGAASRVGGKLPCLLFPLSLWTLPSPWFFLLTGSEERKVVTVAWDPAEIKAFIWYFQCEGSELGRLLTLNAVFLLSNQPPLYSIYLPFCLKSWFH